MSDTITIAQFEEHMKEVEAEMSVVNARKLELQKQFHDLANKIRFDETDDKQSEDFHDIIGDAAYKVFDVPDFEYANIEQGYVSIWESSTC